MKKTIWIFLLLLVILAGLYIFIPGTVRLRQEVSFVVNTNAFVRKFPEYQQWKPWWPGEKSNKNLSFNGWDYQVAQRGMTSLRINIQSKAQTVPSEVLFIPLNDSTIRLQWEAATTTASNPFQRIKRFLNAEALSRDMAAILNQAKAFYSQPVNVYGLVVERAHVKDSALISITTTTKVYPTVDEVYARIEKLQTYASSQGAHQSGLPMLNITATDSNNFRVQTAIPVDRHLPDAGDIRYKWMLGGGNILVAEVKGGPYTISQGFQQMAEYAEDHRRFAPAINYQSLVTDRRKEPDTAKWITKLYWPVM